MRKVVAAEFVSLDGVMESPDKWHFPNFNEEMGQAVGEGGDIVISGSGALVRSLLRYGLLDELKLMIHPILVGSGKRLFEEGEEQTKLELVDSRTFSTGVLYLTYRPARG
jgi:dihydrofolate reductase